MQFKTTMMETALPEQQFKKKEKKGNLNDIVKQKTKQNKKFVFLHPDLYERIIKIY